MKKKQKSSGRASTETAKKPSKKRQILIAVVIAAAVVAVLGIWYGVRRSTGGNIELIGKDFSIREDDLFRDVDADEITEVKINMNDGSLKGKTITLKGKKKADEVKECADMFFSSDARYAKGVDTSDLTEDNYTYSMTFREKDGSTFTIWYYNSFTIRYHASFYYRNPSVSNTALNRILDEYNAKDAYNKFP